MGTEASSEEVSPRGNIVQPRLQFTRKPAAATGRSPHLLRLSRKPGRLTPYPTGLIRDTVGSTGVPGDLTEPSGALPLLQQIGSPDLTAFAAQFTSNVCTAGACLKHGRFAYAFETHGGPCSFRESL